LHRGSYLKIIHCWFTNYQVTIRNLDCYTWFHGLIHLLFIHAWSRLQWRSLKKIYGRAKLKNT
jgi:hypothetical protein